MGKTRVTMMAARSQLGELINRALLRGEEFELERHGRVVAVLVSADRCAELQRAERELEATRANPDRVLPGQVPLVRNAGT